MFSDDALPFPTRPYREEDVNVCVQLFFEDGAWHGWVLRDHRVIAVVEGTDAGDVLEAGQRVALRRFRDQI